MTIPDRIVALIQKLLPVTDPASRSTEAEQTNAARAICNLIRGHKLIVVHPVSEALAPAPVMATAEEGPFVSIHHPRAWVKYKSMRSAVANAPVTLHYRKSRAAGISDCVGSHGCGGKIFTGEPVWRCFRAGAVEYIHFDCLPLQDREQRR